MTNTLTDQLKNIPMFRGLPKKDMETLAQEVTERVFATGETLMRKGDVGDSLFLIVEGGVKIVSEKTPGGTLILNRVGPGETIGEMSLLEQTSRSATVIADTSTKTLELKHEAFLKLLQHRPELGLALIRDMSSRIRFASTYIEKAIDWSKHIAEGNYSAAINSIASAKSGNENPSDEVKADQLLSAFFDMVQDVKAREDSLKKQVETLTLQIDETRRKEQFSDLTQTEFFARLKADAERIRRERSEE